MTITPINPSNITAVPISGFPGSGIPYTNVTPFTYRDGLTYLEVLEDLRAWLRDTLVPWLNDTVGSLESAWHTEVDALVAAVNAALDAQATQVNGALTTQSGEVNENIAALTLYVNSSIAEIINNSLSANDGIVRDLVNNVASLTRVALDAVYQAKGTVPDAAVAALLATATSTRVALDGRYLQSAGTVDVAHGGSGRNTGGTANGIIAVGTTATGAQQTVSPGTAGQVLQSAGAGALPVFTTLIDDTAAAAAKVYSSSKVQSLVDTTAGAVHLAGLYSARPAFATVKAGTIYYATDAQEVYRATGVAGSNATGWAVYGPGGAETGYAEVISGGPFNNPNITYSAVPGCTITITHGERPVLLTAQALVTGSLTPSEVILGIFDGATQIAESHADPATNLMYAQVAFSKRVSAVTAGTVKTYTLQFRNGGTTPGTGGTAAMAVSATFPASIQARTL